MEYVFFCAQNVINFKLEQIFAQARKKSKDEKMMVL